MPKVNVNFARMLNTNYTTIVYSNLSMTVNKKENVLKG